MPAHDRQGRTQFAHYDKRVCKILDVLLVSQWLDRTERTMAGLLAQELHGMLAIQQLQHLLVTEGCTSQAAAQFSLRPALHLLWCLQNGSSNFGFRV